MAALIGIKNLELSMKLFIALFLILVALFLPKNAFAQVSTTSASQLPTTISPTSPVYTDLLVHNLFHTFSCLAVGSSVIGQPCLTYQLTKNAQGAIQGVPMLSSINLQGGTLGTVTGLIGLMYQNPPVRTSEYLASVGQSLGIIKEAHAQGVVGSGASVLSPILTLWQVSRNISYVIMIIIFVIIGLMVMFRQRINPQTVITAQAALPGLVIGLILITFSYFAAALITDTAFIGVNLVGYYFSTAIGDPSKGNLLQQLNTENIVSIGSSFAGKLGVGQIQGIADQVIKHLDTSGGLITNAQNVVKIAIGLIAYQIGAAIGAAGGGLASTILSAFTANPLLLAAAPIAATVGGPIFGSMFAGLAYAFPSLAIGIALYLAALFAVLYAMFRLLLTLLNSYLSIIFLTITAPFHFLFSALPGRQEIAVTWFRNLLSNILAFPAVIAVFYFAAYLLGNNEIKAFGISQQLQVTGTNDTLPLFGGLDLSFVRVLLAFGAILATPKIPEIISRAVGQPGAGAQLIGQAISEATGSGQRYAGQAQQNFGGAVGNYREGWRTWRGQDPYYSGAKKFEALSGRKLPSGLGPQELTGSLYAPPTVSTGGQPRGSRVR